MNKANNSNTKQLKINFEQKRKEVKVISIKRAQNRDLNNKILNRKRPSL